MRSELLTIGVNSNLSVKLSFSVGDKELLCVDIEMIEYICNKTPKQVTATFRLYSNFESIAVIVFYSSTLHQALEMRFTHVKLYKIS